MEKTNDRNGALNVADSFDQLPDCAFVRQPVVEQLFACSAATVWRSVARHRIPKPIKISHRVTVWNVGQLRTALASILSEPPSGRSN